MSTWTPSGGVSAGGVLFLQILIGSTAAYVVATTLYSLTVHPLSDIPGPKGCAVSRIPWWVACLTGNQVRFMVGLHKRYGPVVRFGPNDVSYADDGQAWRDLYGYEKSRPENPKDEVFHAPPANGVPNIITANLRDHARVRKVFAPAFSARALKQQQPLFTKYVDLLVAQLGKKEDADESGWSKTPKDLCMMFNLTTFDIMGELTFGQPLGLLKNARYTPWVQSIFKSLKILPVVQIIEFYAPLKFIYRLIEPQSVKNMRHDHWNHSASRVDKRLEQGSEQPDIWNLAINAETDGAKLVTLAEMHSNAELFMTAGTETSASVLSGLSFFLMANPTKLKLLTEEVRSHFASDADIDLDGLVALPYLNACKWNALDLVLCRMESNSTHNERRHPRGSPDLSSGAVHRPPPHCSWRESRPRSLVARRHQRFGTPTVNISVSRQFPRPGHVRARALAACEGDWQREKCRRLLCERQTRRPPAIFGRAAQLYRSQHGMARDAAHSGQNGLQP